jgi:uncharacterized membrane protein YfcA
MIFKLATKMGLSISLIAFAAEYIDSTLGMGYGTSLTPILLILNFSPLQIVPSILLSELITGVLAGFTHHSVGNVDFRPKTMNPKKIYRAIKELGLSQSFRLGIPLHLKVVLLITVCSIVGTILAVYLALHLPKSFLTLYIGALILIIGFLIVITVNKNYPFSWKKVTFLGVIASFNKGISGGGYGPVITGGQLLSGLDGRNAVGITSMAEGLTCAVGVLTYILTKGAADWLLAPYLVIGAVISVPLSAFTVRKIELKKLRYIIGILTILLGVSSILKFVI